MPESLAFLFDVDNTLIANDLVKDDMERQTRELLGDDGSRRFWDIYEEVREESDFVNLPGTLERYAAEFPNQPGYVELAGRILCYPYTDYLYAGALEAIDHCKSAGVVAIVSDGDRVFQPSKIARSGLGAAVDHRVFVFTHKDQEFSEVERRLPAERYVMVDDKPAVLDALRERLGARLVAVHVRQGRYAEAQMKSGPPDFDLQRIADLAAIDPGRFAAAANSSRQPTSG